MANKSKFSDIQFTAKLAGEGKWPDTMEELVQAWIAFWADETTTGAESSWASDCVHELVEDDGDLGLDFVLTVLATDPHDRVIEVLAAGPLEDALAYHGPLIIDRVEREAAKSPEFQDLLGGVWQNRTRDDIWQRVLRAAPRRW
jgi:hypothetical protein